MDTLKKNAEDFCVIYREVIDASKRTYNSWVGPEKALTSTVWTMSVGDSHYIQSWCLWCCVAFWLTGGTSEVEMTIATSVILQRKPKTIAIITIERKTQMWSDGKDIACISSVR